jgi:hypothetical protein
MMKKPKPPRLVVDNKLPADDAEDFSDEEIEALLGQVIDVHERYPEIDALIARARGYDDKAMWCACVEMVSRYPIWRDLIAEHKRRKLRVVKRKRGP